MENIFKFSRDFNLVPDWGYENYGIIQNFISISLKLCLIGQKPRWNLGLSITIVILSDYLCIISFIITASHQKFCIADVEFNVYQRQSYRKHLTQGLLFLNFIQGY